MACKWTYENKVKAVFNQKGRYPQCKVKYCECGCGYLISSKYRFKYKHSERVKSVQKIEKQRQTLIARYQSDSTLKDRIRNSVLNYFADSENMQKHRKKISDGMRKKDVYDRWYKNSFSEETKRKRRLKLVKIKRKKRSLLCACGCGQMTKPGNKFINGHNHKLYCGENNPAKRPEIRKKISLGRFGSNNPAWNGGSSYEPYCNIWLDKEYKEDIKIRDNYTCQNPYCNGNSDRLVIHHINYNKKDCHPDNLITLCNSCNARANGNREYWQIVFFNIIIFDNFLNSERLAYG